MYECPYVEKENANGEEWKICIEYCGNRTEAKMFYTTVTEKDHTYRMCHLNKTDECPYYLLRNMSDPEDQKYEQYECTDWCKTLPARNDGLCVRCPAGQFIENFACVTQCPNNMFNGTTTWCQSNCSMIDARKTNENGEVMNECVHTCEYFEQTMRAGYCKDSCPVAWKYAYKNGKLLGKQCLELCDGPTLNGECLEECPVGYSNQEGICVTQCDTGYIK